MNFLSSVIRAVRNSFANENQSSLPPKEREEAVRMLRNAVTAACDDGIVTAEEMEEIKGIQQKLEISDEELNEIKLEVLEDLIFKIKEDNIISDEEMKLFESIREGLRFSEGDTGRLSEQIGKVTELYEERKEAEKLWEEGLTDAWRDIFETTIKNAAQAGDDLRLPDIKSVVIDKNSPQIETLEPLFKLPRLRELHILSSQENLRNFRFPEELEVLRISGSEIKLKDVQSIGRLENLLSLNLSFTNLEKIEGISGLFPQLRELNLCTTEIRQIDALSELTDLRSLTLEDTPVQSLRPLHQLGRLEMLNASKCVKLTIHEVRQFYRIFPEVALFSDFSNDELRSAFSPREKAEALIARSERLINEQHFREAVTKLHLALKKDAGNVDAYMLRATAQEKLEMYEAAAEDLREAFRISGNPAAARHLAYILSEHLLDFDDAIRFAEKAVKTDPGCYLSYLTRASVLSDKPFRNFEKALEDNQKGLMLLTQADKSSISAYDKLLAEVYTNIGTCLLFLERYDEAVEHLSGAIKLNDEQGQAYFNRGLVMLEKGNKFAARTDLEIARSLGVAESESVMSKQFS